MIWVGLLISFSALLLPGLNAQNWFPPGATWHYNQIEFLEGESYTRFEITEEITHNGRKLKVIEGSCHCGSGSQYVFEEEDRVYLYDIKQDTFHLLYDLNLLPGDTLVIKDLPTFSGEGIFVIDAVSEIQSGSETLKVQHFTTLTDEYAWGNMFIERIGSNGCFYPQISFCDPSTGGIRCYEDAATGLINFQIPERSCTYITSGIEDRQPESGITLFPNPATDLIQLSAIQPMQQLVLFNQLGMTLIRQPAWHQTVMELNLNALPAGLYHLQVMMNDGMISNHQVVVK